MFGMCGTIYNLTFSHDPQEKYVLIADGTNDKIWIHDRMSGKVVGEIGDNGRSDNTWLLQNRWITGGQLLRRKSLPSWHRA